MSLGYRALNATHNALYRLTGGKVGGRFGKAPVLLLTTTGRKSGKQRTAPLLYLADGDDLVLVASKGGAPSHPAWFANLQAQPEVEVRVGSRRERRRARVADGEERKRLWTRVVEIYPAYDTYQTKTTREIPVVVLERV
jgi:deazaflavin-dependent oxidoreductase (nitroreductase family)